MILQTTGGYSRSAFAGELFPLGSWCNDGDQRPVRTAEDLSAERDLDIKDESACFTRTLEQILYPALNSLHDLSLPQTYWRHTLGTYLRMLIPLLVRRNNLIRRARDLNDCNHFTAVDVSFHEVVPDDRPSMLNIVNTHAWNQVVLAELCESLGLTPVQPLAPIRLQTPDRSAARKLHPESRPTLKQVIANFSNAYSRRSKTLITRSMLPASVEIGLSLRHNTLPYFWTDDFTFTCDVDIDLRKRLSEHVRSTSGLDNAILNIAVNQVPRIFIEDFARARDLGLQKLPRTPRVVFTSNLHQASDVFLLRLSESKVNGSKVVIAQHGGVHSLCKDVPGDIQSERELADRYITWGSPTFTSTNTVAGPTLVNIGSHIRSRGAMASESLLIVADSTYRYPSVPRGMNGDRFTYAALLNDLIRQLDPKIIKRIILRPYRGAEIWDDSITSLLNHDARVDVDHKFPPVQDLFDSARLVVSTALGTTFFQTLHQQVPTAILLDRTMSAVCNEATYALAELERGSILFADPTSLASHLNSVFADINSWWWDSTTQECVSNFGSALSPSTSAPVSFYDSVLRATTVDGGTR